MDEACNSSQKYEIKESHGVIQFSVDEHIQVLELRILWSRKLAILVLRDLIQHRTAHHEK